MPFDLARGWRKRRNRAKGRERRLLLESLECRLLLDGSDLTLAITGPNHGVRGQPLTFSFALTDAPQNSATTEEGAAAFIYAVDWDGDGAVDETIEAGASVRVDHVFSVEGTYSVLATATDKLNSTSGQKSLELEIDIVRVNNGVLFAGGTTGNDLISFQRSGSRLNVWINGQLHGPFKRPDKVIAFGGEGHDRLFASSLTHTPVELYGGPGRDRLQGGRVNDLLDGEMGNDTLLGGWGNDILRGGEDSDLLAGQLGEDILVGGPGNDRLYGGYRRDMIIGGLGRDRLSGSTHDDILIGGLTEYDANDDALLAILSEWTSARNFRTRVRNLTTPGPASGLNGTFFLREGETVFGDTDRDQLSGGSGQDWEFERFDQTPPELNASLTNDTGRSSSDGLTFDPSVRGTVADKGSPVETLIAQLDNLIPVAVGFDRSGSFVFNPKLAADGSADGPHTVTLTASDGAGLSTTVAVQFTLDTTAPPRPSDLRVASETDSGFSNSDGVTNFSSPTVNGSVDGGSSVSLFIDGNFVDRTTAESFWEIRTGSLSDGLHVATALNQDSAGNSSPLSTPLEIIIDTTPPTSPTLGLETTFDTSPNGDSQTTLDIVTLTGIADPDTQIDILENGRRTFSDGDFQVAGVGLALGSNNFTARATDSAGNEATAAPVTIVRLPKTDDIVLQENGVFADEHTELIRFPQAEGSRTVRFELEVDFDDSDETAASQDTLLVYLVDPADPTNTILDRGTPGTALFSINNSGAEFTRGTVRFDGTTVQIDVTSLGDLTEGLLRFQLLGSDPDEGTTVAIRRLTTTGDSEGSASPVFPAPNESILSGSAMSLEALTSTADLEVQLKKVRFDSTQGRYTAEMQVHANAAAVGRTVAVVFKGLPDGVSVLNASGFDAAGNPYINMTEAIPRGGLPADTDSSPVELVVSNPSLLRFSLVPQVLVGPPNRAPELKPVGSLTVMPGGHLEMQLSATDPDGDSVTFSITPNGELPSGVFRGNGTLLFTPMPDQVGTYSFVVAASDGVLTSEQEVKLDVVSDPINSTRISGTVLDTDQQPLKGVLVELGEQATSTNELGAFEFEFPDSLPDDTLMIRGELLPGAVTYPFIAERLVLLLGRDAIAGVNNVIGRPIFLPALDISGGTTIDPTQDTTIEQELSAGETASVFVQAGTLQKEDGSGARAFFDGVLSITEVPRDRTPAALPPNLLPDTVVTIQPGGMVFTEPAKLTLPNRAGFEPGKAMDLWSINPFTGEFDNVGMGRVSSDGSVVETITGGVSNSSWHFFVGGPPNSPRRPDTQDQNQDQECKDCEDTAPAASEVELHSGAIRETHRIVGYQSLGTTRGLTLHYNSQRADPRPIVHFGFDNAVGDANRYLVGRLAFDRAAFSTQVSGFEGGLGLPGGEHFWQVPNGTNDVTAALQTDLRDAPTGIYDYSLTTGLLRLGDNNAFVGSLTDSSGRIVLVNAIDSPFGAGWQLGGVQKLTENSNGSILFVDGNGDNYVFQPNEDRPREFVSPAGDFSQLVKNLDGSFTRTTTEQTVTQYDAIGRVVSITDRNGNTTEHIYEFGKLSRIVDPTGLVTVLQYVGDRVTQITDPVGRVTRLEHDDFGNLVRIIDPDLSSRRFEYNSYHLLTGEIDQLGNREHTFYGFHGRAIGSIRKDGSTLEFIPVQTRALQPVDATSNPFIAPVSSLSGGQAVSLTADSNGNVISTVLDQSGQAISGNDAEGNLTTIQRDHNNQITLVKSPRGNFTEITYDDNGNVKSIQKGVVRSESSSQLFPGEKFPAEEAVAVTYGDFNGDGLTDLVTANDLTDDVSVLLGNGDGTFQTQQRFAAGDRPSSVTTGDFDGDGVTDLATANDLSDDVSVLLGNGDGTFGPQLLFSAGDRPSSVTAGDFDADGATDLATANAFSDDVSVLFGNGDGTFQTQQRFRVGGRPRSLTSGDLNGDGVADLATANWSDQSDDVSVLLGNGDGTFQTQQRFKVGDRPISIALADFNQDGFTDIATANSLSANLSMLLGNGDGTFQPQLPLRVDVSPTSITIGDFNEDGAADLATANFRTVSTLLGNGDGSFQAPQFLSADNSPRSITMADFNEDGFVDLATANDFSGDVSILLGNGDGTFQTQRRINAGGATSSITAGDFNQDGLTDLVTANSRSDDLSVLLGNNDGTFQPQERFSAGDTPRFVDIGDFNEDGVTDLVTTNARSDDLSVLLGNGNGTFQTQQRFSAGDSPVSIGVADFNRDGFTDLATTNSGSNDLSILLGNGDGTFQTQQRFSAGGDVRSVTMADFNGDGLIDLAAANFATDDLSVLLGNGDGTFRTQQRFSAGDGPRFVMAEDFNSDGVSDLATANFATDDLSVLLGIGDGTFQTQQRFSAGDGPRFLTTGDFNRDGTADLVSANANSDDVSIHLGNGNGTFQGQRRFAAGNGPASITTGDFNRDTFTDLATANELSNDVSLLFGRVDTGTPSSTTFTYDPVYNQLTSVTDELGRLTQFAIDTATGNRLSTTRVVGEIDSAESGETDDLVTRFAYTSQGLIDLITDPLGRATDFDYDVFGRVDRIISAVGTTEEAFQEFEYDDAGNQTTIIDENGNKTEFSYDNLNRMTKLIQADPDGGGPLAAPKTTFSYDLRGNLIGTTDAQGSTVANQYDALDRLILTRNDLANETTFSYDLDGNLLSIVDPNGHPRHSRYDARDRVVETVDAGAGVTTFGYDLDDNLIRLTDPNDNSTAFFYDARDRLISEVDPFGAETRFIYDLADNLSEKIDRNGRIVRFLYDELDRLTSEKWLDGDGSLVNQIDYAYDKVGNLVFISDALSALAFSYDNRDRVKTVDNVGTLPGSGLPNVLLSYFYDSVGNIVSVEDSVNAVPGATTAYKYDFLNRTTSVQQTGSRVTEKLVDIVYNQLGQFDAIARFSGLDRSSFIARSKFEYDSLNRLRRLDHTNGTERILAFYEFGYDSEGRTTSLTDADGHTNFSFDDRDQLTVADRETADSRGDESYSYDANGNRTESHRHKGDYVTGPGNRLFSDGEFNYDYDGEGNIIRRTEINTGQFREFEYDHRNRLTRVTDFSAGDIITQDVEYSYDALDRRIARTFDANGHLSGGESAEYFLYDHDDVLLDFVDADGSGSTNQPELATRYLHGPAIDQVLAQESVKTSQTVWLLADHLGTTRDMLDSAGRLLNHITYDSFGNILSQSDVAVTTRYLFTGREFDAAAGLYYYRARFYDANTGKFMSEDPIRFQSQNLNLYMYVENDPVRLSDPLGLRPQPLLLAGTGFGTKLDLFLEEFLIQFFTDLFKLPPNDPDPRKPPKPDEQDPPSTPEKPFSCEDLPPITTDLFDLVADLLPSPQPFPISAELGRMRKAFNAIQVSS